MNLIEQAAQELPAHVRSLVDEHLDGLERVLLSAGVSRPQRQAICEDVELQFREMLWHRSQAAPTAEQARAVLAELDPPEAYVEAVGSEVVAAPIRKSDNLPQRTHTLALIAAVVPALGVISLFLPIGGGEERAIVFLICAEFVALLLGAVAIREIRRFPERWSGIGLAVFGILALPILVANFFSYMVFAPTAYHRLVGKAAFYEQRERERTQQLKMLRRQIDFMRLTKTGEPVEDDSELSERTKQQIAGNEAAIARLEKEATTITPTAFQRVLFEHRNFIRGTCYVIAMGLSGAASILAFIAVLRRCRPRGESTTALG